MTTTYKIKSHWHYITNSLNGRTFESKEDALDALGSDVITEEFDNEEGRAWAVYASKEDAERDAYGNAPHLCIGVIVQVA